MTFRKANQDDIPAIVQMLADDVLGQTREDFSIPLPDFYIQAFTTISNDPNQELIVVENEQREIIGTLQLSFIQYLTYRGGIRAQIEAVRIHKNYRGKGVGSQFFNGLSNGQKKGALTCCNSPRIKSGLMHCDSTKVWDFRPRMRE